MGLLTELQCDFLGALIDADRRVLMRLADDRRLARNTGLAIYENAYGARLREALENDHAILGRYLGDELWERLCASYIAAHPSQHPSLRRFADRLPDFLRSAAPFAEHPQLAEIAAFERCLLDAFDAADDVRTDWHAISRIPQSQWPRLKIRFHPSFRRHAATRNSVAIWQALKREEAPPPVLLDSRQWAICRDIECVTRFRALDDDEAAGIDGFLAGGDFSTFCRTLLRWLVPDTVPARALELLRGWVAEGWLSESPVVGDRGERS